MAPTLLLVTALFAGFLAALALIAFAAFRFSAKREGPALGFPGGCALTAVLLGAAFFAMVGFAIVVGVVVVHRAEESGVLEHWRQQLGQHSEWSSESESEPEADENENENEAGDEAPAPPDAPSLDGIKVDGVKSSGDVREY